MVIGKTPEPMKSCPKPADQCCSDPAPTAHAQQAAASRGELLWRIEAMDCASKDNEIRQALRLANHRW